MNARHKAQVTRTTIESIATHECAVPAGPGQKDAPPQSSAVRSAEPLLRIITVVGAPLARVRLLLVVPRLSKAQTLLSFRQVSILLGSGRRDDIAAPGVVRLGKAIDTAGITRPLNSLIESDTLAE
jgi:hypothetical protein